MPHITKVDFPLTLEAAGDIETWAKKLGEALEALKRVAGELYGCWGDDEFGTKFAGNYLPASGEALESSKQTVAGLTTLAANLREIVRRFDAQDAGQPLELTES
jgi:hypothetical protein